jgi:hypothetical protein
MRASTRIGALVSLAVAAWLAAASASAQAPPVRIRGTVQSLDGQVLLTIATKSDGPVRVVWSDMTGINGLETKIPESMRGAGEGHYAWDLPDSSMTNGAVTGNTTGGTGRTLRVKYADGETDVDVTSKTVIVALIAGDRSLLVPGATVFALAVPAQGGGTPNAVAIIAETKGVKPPM